MWGKFIYTYIMFCHRSNTLVSKRKHMLQKKATHKRASWKVLLISLLSCLWRSPPKHFNLKPLALKTYHENELKGPDQYCGINLLPKISNKHRYSRCRILVICGGSWIFQDNFTFQTANSSKPTCTTLKR